MAPLLMPWFLTLHALQLRFTVQDMDNKIRMAKYAVRGAVPARAGELAQQWPDRQECIGIGVAQDEPTPILNSS